MTRRHADTMTTTGFAIGYVALMLLLICLTSPHFEGYRHLVVPMLGGFALVGALLLVAARFAPSR